MKILKRILFYTSLAAAVVLISSTASLFLFKDRIIQQFIREANKSLSTPINIGKIDISSWEDWPNLAIVFHDVYVEDSHPGKYPLLTAKEVSFYLNPLEVWRGQYTIRGLRISESETHLKIDKEGKTNYVILKDNAAPGEGTVKFELDNVKLNSTVVTYRDLQRVQEHLFSSKKLTASIAMTENVYDILARGDVTTEQIGIGSSVFLKSKTFQVDADLRYDDINKNLLINPSTLDLQQSVFDVKGTYQFKTKNLIDITCDGKDTNLQTILSLLPEAATQKLSQYESEGDVFFNLLVKGEIADRKDPYVSIRFGCTDATLYHPDYQSRIEHATLEGSFASPSLSSLRQAELFMKNITGELNGQAFRADFSLQNFEDPNVTLVFKGDLDAQSVLLFYPIPQLSEVSGRLGIDISFEGRTALLKRKATAQQVHTSGNIDVHQINFTINQPQVSFRDLNGSLRFNNNDLALSDVSGRYGNSDFKLNGFFKNIITFLLFEGQPIGIETDLSSDFLDVDQLFAIGFGDETSEAYRFSISPQLYLNFNCDVKALQYKRFKPRNIKGNLLVKDQTAVSRNITFDAMGGKLALNGIVDAHNAKAIEVVSSFQLHGIHVDSAFYVFQNFQQDFIEDRHLKGEATADVSLEMVLNQNLKLFPETLIADISTTIRNGQLNNFDPLKGLSKYIDDEGLSRLRFADLKNDIHIENKIIYLPLMEVKSNVSTLQISGTHSFDQHIDYRVITPLRNKKKIDPDEAFGAIEEDNTGQSKLFLKITGTTDNYRISYDKEAVKKKIVSDLKKEVKELKEAFRLKGKEKRKELELSNEEFEWGDTTNVKKNN